MAERKQIKIPQKYIDKYGENIKLWSYSKVSSIDNCLYEYYLNRILKYKGVENIYSLCGSVAHDILEDFYNNKITYENMINIFHQKFLEIEVSDFKFSPDEEKNKKMQKKYRDCMTHFFHNHIPITTKVLTEREIWIDIDGNIFFGYIDTLHKEDDMYIITDYKTSSISEYSGTKLKDKSKQLLLYALGLNQLGITFDKIKIRWNFLKYTNIIYQLKNKKFKTIQAERNKWVSYIKTPLKKDIIAFYQIDEYKADSLVADCIYNNSLKSIDKSISDKYKLEDCYVYGILSEEIINELRNSLTYSINIILNKNNDESNWEINGIKDKQEYYCNVLCSQRLNCKYYKEYLNNLKNKNQSDIDLLLELENL